RGLAAGGVRRRGPQLHPQGGGERQLQGRGLQREGRPPLLGDVQGLPRRDLPLRSARRMGTKKTASVPPALPDRGDRGYEVYAAGMEASAADKAKLLPYVRPGVIADLGCG